MNRLFVSIHHTSCGLSTLLLASLLLAAAPVLANPDQQAENIKRYQPVNGEWIIELTSPPTALFEGDVVETVRSDGRTVRKALEATALSMTGGSRLDVQSPAAQAYARHLDEERAQVLDAMQTAMGRSIEPRHVYRHLINGFSIQLSSEEAARIQAMPGVASVTPNIVERTQMDSGRQWIGTENYWNGTGVPSPNRGEGMVLGVVDTGINWNSFLLDNDRGGLVTPVTNPRPGFLGLCSDSEVQCSEKLIGVYDFTDEDTKGNDPDGHGTHVATTALGFPAGGSIGFGGPPIFFNLSGIAPQANLIAYKACQLDEDDPDGPFTCFFSDTIAALEQAIADQVDVVNYSIGGSPRDPWQFAVSPERVFLNMRAAGIVASVSAGNSGPGPNTVGSPANAPWIMAVANATHNRGLVNRLVATSGGTFDIGNLEGRANTEGTDILPIVHARDFGNALCGTGTAELGNTCAANTGASNPFAPGTFNGQIVVCDRGTYGRIEKGRNVQLAGAAGMILANTQAQSESTNSDTHCLPATHLGADDGDQIRAWLDAGSNHQGRLAGTTRVDRAEFGGRLNISSSRGPSEDSPGVMKPNVTAPGTDVVAGVNEQDGNPNLVGLLTGTSMAAPHAAGAALLLRNSNPSWGPDQVISALETTADASIVFESDSTEASIVDRGAGGIQVDRASRIGLYLPTSTSAFLSANPATGGIPGDLNLPGIIADGCAGQCTFTRTLRALGSATWTVSTEGNPNIQVSPSSFTLSNGQEQQLTVTLSGAAIGQWSSGAVVLEPSGSQFITQRLPVGARGIGGELPERRNYLTQNNRGRGTLLIENAAALPEAVFVTSPLIKPEQRLVQLPQDPTTGDPYDGGDGVFTELVPVPADTLVLQVETLASDSNDVDLFVGLDLNGNGQADENEEVCTSLSFDDLEECIVRLPAAGNWWILVQNWNASSPSANDNIPFLYGVMTAQDDPSLVVSGAGSHPGGDLELPVYWIQDQMLEDERWFGAVGIASSPDSLANVGVVPVSVRRTATNQPLPTPLFEGRAEPVIVPGDGVHDSVFIDVPPSATELVVEVDGSLEAVTVQWVGLNQINSTFDPSVSGSTVATASVSNGVWTARVTPSSGSTLTAGRYIVRMENDLGPESLVSVTANVTETGRLEPGIGLYSPRDRLIFQGFQWGFGGGNAFIIWYSFDEDGLATFYLSGSEPPDPSSSYYTAPLFRFTSNGVRQTADQVGEIQIMTLSDTQVSYAWTLNGTRNAEIQVIANGQDCPIEDGQAVPYQGLWFPDGVREGGASVLATENVEIWIRYYFDQSGQPRWVFGDGLLTPTLDGGKRLRVDEYRGF
ncbi:MAG: S8 family serine peptidase, partial [Pseudomonadota bacterium]